MPISEAQSPSVNKIIRPSEQIVATTESLLPVFSGDELNITTEEQLLKEFARYRKLMQAGTLDEADNTAKRIVEIAIRIHGLGSKETANALNNLGVVQHAIGQYNAAIQNLTSAIEIIEAVEGPLDKALIGPLKGLGAAQLASGRPDQANKTFYQAAHITHVNEGPHNRDQIEILESIAETFIRIGNIQEARNAIDRIHILNVKNFESDPISLLPLLMKRAAWQSRTGHYKDERATYRKVIRIIESNYEKNSRLLIKPLRKLGESLYFIDRTFDESDRGMLTGETYFKRSARIAEKFEDIDEREYVTAQLALADYYIYSGSIGRARRIYADIWQYLSINEEHLSLRSELLSGALPIVPMRTNQLPIYAGNPSNKSTSPDNIITGRVVARYNISARGRVQNLQSEVFPAEFSDMRQIIQREIRNRIYRPKIVNGKLMETIGIVFEHPFFYRSRDLEVLKKRIKK